MNDGRIGVIKEKFREHGLASKVCSNFMRSGYHTMILINMIVNLLHHTFQTSMVLWFFGSLAFVLNGVKCMYMYVCGRDEKF